MVKRNVLLTEALGCIDRSEHNRDPDLVVKAIAICFVVVTGILVEECKVGGAIDRSLGYRRQRRS